MGVTPSVPVKANSGVRARVRAAEKVLEGDDQPTLLREDQHYLHYITIFAILKIVFNGYCAYRVCSPVNPGNLEFKLRPRNGIAIIVFRNNCVCRPLVKCGRANLRM